MSICERLNCSHCCHDREVILTHEDVTKLLTMGHYEQVFARPSRHGHNLKELIFERGDCIFLKSGRCSVYENRPTACRIFPFTYDETGGSIDPACPHGDSFENDENFLRNSRIGMEIIVQDVEKTVTAFKKAQQAKKS